MHDVWAQFEQLHSAYWPVPRQEWQLPCKVCKREYEYDHKEEVPGLIYWYYRCGCPSPLIRAQTVQGMQPLP